VEQDLGAVGAVGVPSAGGVSFDPEPVVDLGVVAFAEQPGVLRACLSVIEPVQEVMDVGLAPMERTSFTAA
jgi:hypothetical protein